MEWIAENLKRLYSEVESAAVSCGRSPQEVRVIAVSKTVPASAVRAAAQWGQIFFGENRVQEARDKIPSVGLPQLEWHLIGHLQSNKVRQAVELFDGIETVDSDPLAARIDRVCGELGRVMPVLIEVNLAGEEQKSGVLPSGLEALADSIDQLPNLELKGLMAIPPFSPNAEDSRPYFYRLARLSDELNRRRPTPLPDLSMGMTGDYRVAIQEGSTIVRIGTAIFGARSRS